MAKSSEWHAILKSLVISFLSLQNNFPEIHKQSLQDLPQILLQKLITIKLEQKHNYKYN